MATVTFPLSTSIPAAAGAPKKGLLRRFYDALMEARLQAAMREIRLHRHLLPEGFPVPEVVPHDEVKRAGYKATHADAGMLPFVRGA